MLLLSLEEVHIIKMSILGVFISALSMVICNRLNTFN